MPVVQAFNAIHAASSADKHVVSLQAMQFSVEEWDVCLLVAESLPPHLMAQQALLITKLSEDAINPKKGSSAAAGYDLSSAVNAVVPAQQKVIVTTDLSVAVPSGIYGCIAPRSGLAAKHHLAVGAGVINADFRGNVKIVIFNHGNLDFHDSKGDRIAQLLLERIESPPVVVVTQLPGTNRGYEGFGSAGIAVLEAGGCVVATPPVSSDRPDFRDQ